MRAEAGRSVYRDGDGRVLGGGESTGMQEDRGGVVCELFDGCGAWRGGRG